MFELNNRLVNIIAMYTLIVLVILLLIKENIITIDNQLIQVILLFSPILLYLINTKTQDLQ